MLLWPFLFIILVLSIIIIIIIIIIAIVTIITVILICTFLLQAAARELLRALIAEDALLQVKVTFAAPSGPFCFSMLLQYSNILAAAENSEDSARRDQAGVLAGARARGG